MSFAEKFSLRSVAALMATGDGRYLMQHRDAGEHVSMRDMWGAFGGWIEKGESAEAALIRELQEELGFTPKTVHWFQETAYTLPGVNFGPIHKTFFHVSVEPEHIEDFRLNEGQDMRLFTPRELMKLPNFVPWDLFGVTCYERRKQISTRHKGKP